MSIPVVCPTCGTNSKAPDNLAGKRAKCRHCGTLIAIPSVTKICPFCAETIAAAAIKCRFCDELLDGRENSAAKSKQVAVHDAELEAIVPPVSGQSSVSAAQNRKERWVGERAANRSWRMFVICAVLASVLALTWIIATGGSLAQPSLWHIALALSAFSVLLTVIYMVQYLFCVIIGRFIWQAALDGKAITSIPPSVISTYLYSLLLVLVGACVYSGYLFGPHAATFNETNADWTKWCTNWGNLAGAGAGLLVGFVIAAVIEQSVTARSCPKCKWYWSAEVVVSEFAGSNTTSLRTFQRVHTYDATGKLAAMTDVPVEKQTTYDTYNVYCRCRRCGHQWSSRRSRIR